MTDKARVPMTPNSIPIYRICGGIQNLERLAENAEFLGDYSDVKISKDMILFKTRNSKTRIIVPPPVGIKGSDCKVQQVFVYVMCRIRDELLERGRLKGSHIEFSVSDLVDSGIYYDYQTAKKGFDSIATFLGGIRVSTNDKKFIEEYYVDPEKRDIAFAQFVLFSSLTRKNHGKIEVDINTKINWKKLIDQYIGSSPVLFSLPNMPFRLAMAILERIRIEKYTGPFDMSMRYVMSRMNLPSTTRKPERDVKAPLRNAIDSINENSETLGFKIVPHYDEKGKFSKMLEDGYLTVVITKRRSDIDGIRSREKLAKMQKDSLG